MIETLTLIIICTILLIIFRPGKTPPLANPLVIERAGEYHVTLAPQLNLAQPFIEAIANELSDSPSDGHSATQYFEVNDVQAKAHGHETYLLAITRRNDMIYFQAASPQPEEPDHLRTISDFSFSVLTRFPTLGDPSPTLDTGTQAAIHAVATPRGIKIKQLVPVLKNEPQRGVQKNGSRSSRSSHPV